MEQNISDEELSELKALMQDEQLSDATTALFEKVFNDFPEIKKNILANDRKDTILESIFFAGKLKQPKPVKNREIKNIAKSKSVAVLKYIPRWVAAASVILLMSMAGYLLYSLSGSENSSTAKSKAALSEIIPGTTGALLTLANGKQVLLDSIKSGIVALQGGVTARVVDGRLVYEGAGTQVVYNTISTPKGRQFQLGLPDGTVVWLNSQSSITYPVVFTANERNVSVTGEVYMDVAKNKAKPFKVNINNKAAVEVLGTQFNISAYDDDENISTTLIEGSVKVYAGNHTSVIKPGQQAKVDAGATGSGIVVQNADVEAVVAWKNGYFKIDGNLEMVMCAIARWYDIELQFEPNVPKDIQLWGFVSRSNNLSDVLYQIERVNKVRFVVHGRNVIVKKYNKSLN